MATSMQRTRTYFLLSLLFPRAPLLSDTPNCARSLHLIGSIQLSTPTGNAVPVFLIPFEAHFNAEFVHAIFLLIGFKLAESLLGICVFVLRLVTLMLVDLI